MLKNRIQQLLAKKKSHGLYRQRHILTPGSPWCFSSNDYLSLTSHPQVRQAYQHAVTHYPSGSGGSMLIAGYHEAHQAVEAAFAAALGVEDCLLLTSGFLANLSIVQLLQALDAHILIDKEAHASIYHALSQSTSPYTRFVHNDLASLERQLLKSPVQGMIVTESVFSMSGQIAPLKAISRLGQQHQHGLIVDEAHAFGVYGPEGLGWVKAHQLTADDVPLRVIPLGKAAAAMGAIIAGRGEWIEALLQVAKPYIYSTGMSPALAFGLIDTLHFIQQAHERREKLHALVAYFRQAIKTTPWCWRDSSTPIQQLQLGCSFRSLHVADFLKRHGIHCMAIRPPTVSPRETGLRVILNYHHEPEHIDRLLLCIQQALQHYTPSS